jgi:hypothetical protein
VPACFFFFSFWASSSPELLSPSLILAPSLPPLRPSSELESEEEEPPLLFFLPLPPFLRLRFFWPFLPLLGVLEEDLPDSESIARPPCFASMSAMLPGWIFGSYPLPCAAIRPLLSDTSTIFPYPSPPSPPSLRASPLERSSKSATIFENPVRGLAAWGSSFWRWNWRRSLCSYSSTRLAMWPSL